MRQACDTAIDTAKKFGDKLNADIKKPEFGKPKAKTNVENDSGVGVKSESVDTQVSVKGGETEKVYRTMSKKEYEKFEKNSGKLSRREKGKSELFVTDNKNYPEKLKNRRSQKKRTYEETVEIELEKGTMDKIRSKGAAHPSAEKSYPNLPRTQDAPNRPEVKYEKGGTSSVGLGRSDKALKEFNKNVRGYKKIEY